MAHIPRSDELAAQSEMDLENKFKRNVSKGANILGSLAATYAGSRLTPFFSDHLPVDLAIKGINKINPKLGQFLTKGQQMGLDVSEGMNFIKDKMGISQNESLAQDTSNVIQQYSPELYSFLDQEIKRGRSPIQAAAIAQMGRKGEEHFKDIIKKITKDHKTDWSSIVNSVFGNMESPQQGQPQEEESFSAQQPNNMQNDWTQAMQIAKNLLSM